MPMDRNRYPHNWPKASRTIRRIAGNRCEWCGIENGVPLPSGRKGKVVLTVAHLGTPYADGKPGNKHDKHDIRRENLAALCQACHLRYDLEDHIEHARATRARKKHAALLEAGQLPLFPVPQDISSEATGSTTNRAGIMEHTEQCRFALKQTCNAEPPVERAAGFAGLFPHDAGKIAVQARAWLGGDI